MAHPIPDAALDDRLGFVGMTGSGKTFGASTCVERILAKRGRVIIPDPLGVWWGLRQMADGKTPSPYEIVIFGGPHADLPVTPLAGALIGETVAGMRESAIIDLSQFETAASERRFMLAFLDTLYRRSTGEPVHLIFDEADLWAPERIVDREGEATKLHGVMQSVVRRGRVKGLTSWLISQRPAALAKSVLSQVDGLVAFSLTASQDRKALGSWIEGQADQATGKAILGRLPEKKQGEAVVWLPKRGILTDVRFPLKETYDSSRAPKRGEKRNRVELRPLDVGALKDRLATVEAETKANDPRTLKDEILRLGAELKKTQQNIPKNIPPSAEVIEAAERKAFERGSERGFAEGLAVGQREAFLASRERVLAAAAAIEALAGEAPQKAPQRHVNIPKSTSKYFPPPKPSAAPREADSAKPRPAPSAAQESLSGPHQRILDGLSWWQQNGIDRPTRVQAAFAAGYKPETGTFKVYLGQLSSAGLISYPSPGVLELTNSGVEKARKPDRIDSIQSTVKAILSGPQIKLLDPLIGAYPGALSRDELAIKSGYQPGTGTFKVYVGQLSSLKIADYPERGMVRAADWLFP